MSIGITQIEAENYYGPVVTGKVDVRLALTPAHVEELFWQMDDSQQAEFFNQLGLRPNLRAQLAFVSDHRNLNRGGRNAMALIGEYAELS